MGFPFIAQSSGGCPLIGLSFYCWIFFCFSLLKNDLQQRQRLFRTKINNIYHTAAHAFNRFLNSKGDDCRQMSEGMRSRVAKTLSIYPAIDSLCELNGFYWLWKSLGEKGRQPAHAPRESICDYRMALSLIYNYRGKAGNWRGHLTNNKSSLLRGPVITMMVIVTKQLKLDGVTSSQIDFLKSSDICAKPKHGSRWLKSTTNSHACQLSPDRSVAGSVFVTRL